MPNILPSRQFLLSPELLQPVHHQWAGGSLQSTVHTLATCGNHPTTRMVMRAHPSFEGEPTQITPSVQGARRLQTKQSGLMQRTQRLRFVIFEVTCVCHTPSVAAGLAQDNTQAGCSRRGIFPEAWLGRGLASLPIWYNTDVHSWAFACQVVPSCAKQGTSDGPSS